ncbi:MAG: DUF5110 domain-containing protein [Muribaculaceae bacterium]|nr:DUF5110 domain-containing protein [Muribaculaceae bacterium]
MSFKKTRIFYFIGVLLLTSCGGAQIKKNKDGVTVRLQKETPTDTRLVRVSVINEKIIRVSATPDETFIDKESLVVVPQDNHIKFNIEETDSTVKVSTACMSATVNLKSGHVVFTNQDGKIIVAEDPEGRSFSPIEAEGRKGYSIGQVFLSLNDEEAIYGLGQHQADEFNYKGRNEELFQYNTKVSVPFVISTDGYGILWDSYSLVRWGNPEDYKQLGKVFKLFNKEGQEGSLTGTYVPANGETLVRNEDSIYFEHLDRSDHLRSVVNLPKNFKFQGSHVTYEGEIEPLETGEYRFIQYYAGYQTISIGGEVVSPERWRTAWNPNAYKFSLNMEAGKKYPIKIEWIPDGGTSYAGLRVYAPNDPSDQLKMRWWSEMQQQEDYYFIYGNSMDDVIAGYRTLTGKASILPKWAWGFWQSREKYNNQDELLEVVAKYRELGIPLDNIVQDWFYWKEDQWGSHEFDEKRFPDPKGMVDSVHAMNARIMISVWPKFYANTEHFKEFDDKRWMYRLAVEDSIRDWVGKGHVGSFYDAYHPEARKLFWQQMEEHLYPLGFDAWWMDASEPNIRDCTDIQYRKDLITPTALGPSSEYFNAYGLMNAEAIYNGQRGVDPDKRVFLLTRSGFAGQQKYSTVTWSGDIGTTWGDLKSQISAGLNFAASGIPFWSMDIGGFCVQNKFIAAQKEYQKTGKESEDLKEWRELNTRWFQFGAFAPIYRAHGQWPFRELYNIAPENHPAYNSILYYTNLRYDLMPYIYSLAGMTHFDDYTIMRPMAMDFTNDKKTYNLGDQYMFGPSLLVAPVYEYGARNRSVYLPEGYIWFDLYSGKNAGSGDILAEAPYERMPLFVKGGSILPLGPEIQWTDQNPGGEITLFVYEGADGDFTLYEDEGLNYNYEKGEYSNIPFSYNDASSTLHIGERKGSFKGMPAERKFKVVKVGKGSEKGFNREVEGKEVTYSGHPLQIKL